MDRHRDGLDPYVLTLIQVKARKLMGKYGYTDDDLHDIEQELLLDLIRRQSHFDPAKAKFSTFASRVVDHQIATLIEERRAAKRDYRATAHSLDEVMVIEQPREVTTKGECVDRDVYRGRVQDANRTQAEELDLSLDVQAAVLSLPPDLRELCRRLRTASVSEVSAETGIPRGTLYERIRRIRAAFRRSGLADYLHGGSDTSRPSPVGKWVKGPGGPDRGGKGRP